MSIPTTRNLTDSALAYLLARPGERFKVTELAQFFGCGEDTMRSKLVDLRIQGKISAKKDGHAMVYWAESKGAIAGPRQSPIKHKAYALPSALAERVREVQEHRAANPSKHI